MAKFDVFREGLIPFSPDMIPPQEEIDKVMKKGSRAQQKKLKEVLLAIDDIHQRNECRKILQFFRDDGPWGWRHYPKHKEFFDAGAKYPERAAIAGNRVGKSFLAGFEIACHATGSYPDWWVGKRFTKAPLIWVVGQTSKTTRDILQFILMGKWNNFGRGMIPGETYLDDPKNWSNKAGVPEAIDKLRVDHLAGGKSEIVFKSYDQGEEAFYGVAVDLVLLDEEPPLRVYNECQTRLLTTKGHMLVTFTPLHGISEVIRNYYSDGINLDQSKKHVHIVNITWDDVPHITQEEKDRLLASTPPYLREARSKGIPALGAGAVYPVPESDYVVDPFRIPAWWPKCGGMDVGWNKTACIWGALDRDNDVLYLFSEYYRGQAEPAVHAEAIKTRGAWIPLVIDPASRGRSQADGKQLFKQYKSMGLDVTPAKNTVEAGIHEIYMRLTTGRLKVFSSLTNFLTEMRMYSRDENGKIMKRDDHLCDAARYLCLSGLVRAKTHVEHKSLEGFGGGFSTTVPVDSITGY